MDFSPVSPLLAIIAFGAFGFLIASLVEKARQKAIRKKVTFGVTYESKGATYPILINAKHCSTTHIAGEIFILDPDAIDANTLSVDPLIIEFKYADRNEVREWWEMGKVYGVPISLSRSTITIQLKRRSDV